MTTERLREIAANCEDVSFIASEENAQELRQLADELEHNSTLSVMWQWNRRIIEDIRAAVPGAPVTDEGLASLVSSLLGELAAENATLRAKLEAAKLAPHAAGCNARWDNPELRGEPLPGTCDCWKAAL